MTEPRMRARAKGQQFSTADLEALLTAYGDAPGPSLPATISTLDAIITDFIIETCHLASLSATYSHRQKIKTDDFKFALRRDPKKLGRVTELLNLDRDFKRERRAFQVEEEELARREGLGKRGRKKAGLEGGDGNENGKGDGDKDNAEAAADEGDGRKKKKQKKKPGRKKKVRDGES